MRSWASTQAWFNQEYSAALANGISLPTRVSIKKVYDLVKDNLHSLKLQARARAYGCSVEVYLNGSIGGVKFTVKNTKSIQVQTVAWAITSALCKDRGFEERDPLFRSIIWALDNDLEAPLNEALKQIENINKAKETVNRHKEQAQRQRQIEANELLTRTMESWPYAREEVLAAWDLAQVKKVMES